MNKKNVKVENIQTPAKNVSALTFSVKKKKKKKKKKIPMSLIYLFSFLFQYTVNRTMNYDTTPTPNKTTNRKDSYYQDQKQWVSTEPNESTTIDDEIQQRQ
jgi:hypothetical protein